MSKPTVNVAIALLFHRRQVLVGWREAKQHQGNKHEFPGGKVEQGETPEQACRREVIEEVGIDVDEWHAFDVIRHEYDDIHVHLHLFHAMVTQKQLDQIQAPWTWYAREQLPMLNFPKANDAIIQRLHWSHQIKITTDPNAISSLDSDQMLYLRIENLTAELREQISALKPEQLKRLILNVTLWNALDSRIQGLIGAVHFKHAQVLALEAQNGGESDDSSNQQALRRPIGIRSIAACHDQASVARAQSLGFDAVLLSPVLNTTTHLDADALGWAQFKQIAETCDIPVFALGGLKPENLAQAQAHAAYGVAGIRHF